jgi:hypothetical protein
VAKAHPTSSSDVGSPRRHRARTQRQSDCHHGAPPRCQHERRHTGRVQSASGHGPAP